MAVQPVKKQYTDQEKADYRKKRQDEKELKAKDPNTSFVETETVEAGDVTQFINNLNFVMKRIRMTAFSRRSKISSGQLEEVSSSLYNINNQLNLFLCKAYKLANLPYRPPRGFADMTKLTQIDRAATELDAAIDWLMSEREQIEKRIVARDKQLAVEKEASVAKQTAATAVKKTPSKAKADSGVETIAVGA